MTPDSASPIEHQLREMASVPVRLVTFGRAGDLLENVGPRSYLHSGPPIRPADAIGAQRGGMIAALLLEGEAHSPEEAERIIDAGEVELCPCHDRGGVGALAGIVAPSTPVVIVEREGDSQTFATVIEGLGRAMSFGNFDAATLDKVRWLSGEFCEVLNEAFEQLAPIDILKLQAKGLRRGDEGHNRIVASTESLIAMLAPAFARIGERGAGVLAELGANPHFFLTLSMAAAKAVADAIHRSGPPGIVTALTGNGIEAGIRVSGFPEPWYVGPATAPLDMMLVKGRSAGDAAPLMGDSGVTETVGLGAFSLTSSLPLARVLGLDARQAAGIVEQMRQISVTDHPFFLLPADDFRGSPLGISVEAVVRSGITPALNAGYANRIPGEGRVGANLAWFPMEPFRSAMESWSAAGQLATASGQEARHN